MTTQRVTAPVSGLAETLQAQLDRLKREGLYRSRALLESPQGARVRLAQREFVSFASNDYLG